MRTRSFSNDDAVAHGPEDPFLLAHVGAPPRSRPRLLAERYSPGVERELVLTGIGGQGIQLAAQVLARAAIAEGRSVQMFGSYGGMMRGGNTEATVVLADGAIEAPPTIGETWSAIFMHHDFSEPTRAKLRPGALVLVNTTVFEGSFDADQYRVVEVAGHRPRGRSRQHHDRVDGDARRVRRRHRHRRPRRARRRGRRVAAVVPHPARGAGTSPPSAPASRSRRARSSPAWDGGPRREHRPAPAAPSSSTSRRARAATSASTPARRGCSR